MNLEDSTHILSCEGTVNDGSYDIILNSPITTEEVHNAINWSEEHKAPGLDKVCPSILKCNDILDYRVTYYQCCFKNGSVPQAWTESTILPIYEGSGNKHDPNNYRGIQSCITKSFYTVLNNRLCLYLEKSRIR